MWSAADYKKNVQDAASALKNKCKEKTATSCNEIKYHTKHNKNKYSTHDSQQLSVYISE